MMNNILIIDMNNKADLHGSFTSVNTTPERPVHEDMQDYIDIYKEVKAREWHLIGTGFEFVLNDIPIKENAKGNGIYVLNG